MRLCTVQVQVRRPRWTQRACGPRQKKRMPRKWLRWRWRCALQTQEKKTLFIVLIIRTPVGPRRPCFCPMPILTPAMLTITSPIGQRAKRRRGSSAPIGISTISSPCPRGVTKCASLATWSTTCPWRSATCSCSECQCCRSCGRDPHP